MEHLHRIYDMLDRELEEISNRGGEMNTQTLDQVDEISHAMKCLKTVIAMEESEKGRNHRYEDDGRSYYSRRR